MMFDSNVFRFGIGICLLIVTGVVYQWVSSNIGSFIEIIDLFISNRIVWF